ncbi:MAG: redoxin domain-containing protein [Bacteroidetes bacterium]|jgi:thiol-disulfide isomerase/thioredoxin|nr:redoxin domain-containing protein [Bacteroidota bacterium]
MLIPATAAFMMVVGLAFIYLILRPNERPVPQDGLQWTGVLISALLVGLSGLLLLLALRPSAPAEVIRDTTSLDVAPDELDQPAENFEFRLVDSEEPQQLADYEGQVVLLNFWATWCAPCLEELPDLNRLQARYGERGLVVLTISDEARDVLLDFQQTRPLDTVSGFIPDRSVLPQPFRRTSAVRPASFVIDREGRIQEYVKGAGDYAYFERLVLPYLDADLAAR